MADSAPDIRRHNRAVARHLKLAALNLVYRGERHDLDKLQKPDKSGWDRVSPRLDVEFGTPAYFDHLRNNLHGILERHYEVSDHHPEHFEQGVSGMNLLNLLEFLVDVADICKQHGTGDVLESLRISVLRFKIEPQLESVLINTLVEMDLL